MIISVCRNSVKTFCACNNVSQANVVVFDVVLFVEFNRFISCLLFVCLFVRMDGLLFTGLHLEGI